MRGLMASDKKSVPLNNTFAKIFQINLGYCISWSEVRQPQYMALILLIFKPNQKLAKVLVKTQVENLGARIDRIERQLDQIFKPSLPR
jgi:hypothetical protein